MLEVAWAFIDRLLGLQVEAKNLSGTQMAWRTFVVFIYAISLARIGDRRMLGNNAGFDIILLVVLGSVLSRGINGQAAFFPTLGASALLVGLHHLVASLAFRSHWFSKLVKGEARLLVHKGQVDRAALKRSLITNDDLDENLRLNGNIKDLRSVDEARLERDGTISVVKEKGGG